MWHIKRSSYHIKFVLLYDLFNVLLRFFFYFHVHYKCQNERVGGDDDDDGEDITERGRVSAILF